MDELIKAEDGLLVSSDNLLAVAEAAEKRIEAVKKIKVLSLKVTNSMDWTNQGGKPYLQVSGAEKVARLFGISWRIDEPLMDQEEDGHFGYTYKGVFSFGGASIEAIGTRSSKDPFFSKSHGEVVPPDKIDKSDVKKAALTNCLGNGITRLLGIRNLTWKDLEDAGIPQESVGKVEYKKGNQPPLQEPQKKSNGTPSAEQKTDGQKIVSPVQDIEIQKGVKDGKPWTRYSIAILQDGKKVWGKTFSETIGKLAEAEKGTGMPMAITWESSKYGMEIKELARAERDPGAEG